MKALKHPLWTHIPGALLWVAMFVAFWRVWPLPDPAPAHFGGDGTPDRWGAQWEIPLIVLLVSLVAIAVSIAVDEFWARQEKRKRFNWASLIDEVFLGFLTAMTFQYVEALETTPYFFRHSWSLTGGLVLIAALGAVLLEIMRPHRSSPLDGSAGRCEPTRDRGGVSPEIGTTLGLLGIAESQVREMVHTYLRCRPTGSRVHVLERQPVGRVGRTCRPERWSFW